MQIKKIVAIAGVALLLAGCAKTSTVAVVTATPLPTPVETPASSPTPIPTTTPEPTPTPNPYFTDEEQVKADEENGYWFYTSPTLWVEINRVHDEENSITYFAAEIRLKEGETERGGFSTPERPGGKSDDLYEIARYYQSVIAVNGDFLDHHEEDPKGVIIRDGIVFVDDDEQDTLVFMPDGSMKIFAGGEITADELLAQGVKNAFSFGPTLIKDGGIQQDSIDNSHIRKKNPRTAVGMFEPYHFLLVVVDGRGGDYSVGMTLTELAELFASYGCTVAYNMDGGQSATMTFMGENISQYAGSLTGQRPVPDALMFGTSDLVAGS